jgi:hypothetical protein
VPRREPDISPQQGHTAPLIGLACVRPIYGRFNHPDVTDRWSDRTRVIADRQ